jgi:DNA-binding helix-hairpin-helix protein with protein kinase domain
MTLHGLNNEQYITGRELGRGGEGAVFELQNYSSVVLKKYNAPLPADKINKLRYMVAARGPAIEAYAAWPTNLAMDDAGQVCGFVMKKLTGYAPLHMIFSPMDRKKMFPDKGYNFLVHVARNLATAFYNLHEAGMVVGDVNEGNILVSSSGLVAFIDCDSFQLKEAGNYFFCEVGVPRYTPPELLSEKAFENIVRTVNTDSFSLAVLIFQLLFLGRHPFAGKTKVAGDLDEEKAIKQRQFAYSLDNKRKKLHPPTDSFPITNLPEDIIALFHRSFEQDGRPAPAEWARALDSLLAGMVTCAESKLHTYPSMLKDCPWCYFKEQSGILYFLDDTHTHATAALQDIENFVNGYNPEKLELKKWAPPPFPQLAPTPIEKKFYSYRNFNKITSLSVIVACLLLYFLFPASAVVFLFAMGIPVLVHKYSRWTRKIKNELARRAIDHKKLTENLDRLVREHDSPPDLAVYTTGLDRLNSAVNEYRRLPEEYERRAKTMEENNYNEQLDEYLKAYNIAQFTIPSFGPLKKSALHAAGIKTAADITKLQAIKITGIGQKNIQMLLSWRRQMATGFVFIPDPETAAAGARQVSAEIAAMREQLEKKIRKEYQSVNYMRLNIYNRAVILQKHISSLSLKVHQANIDLMTFRKFAA